MQQSCQISDTVYRRKAYKGRYASGSQAARIVAAIPAPKGKVGGRYFKFAYVNEQDIDGEGKEEVLNIKSFQKKPSVHPFVQSPHHQNAAARQ